MSNTHELKILKEFYEAKLKGLKMFECRFDDRGFKVGDYLRLREIISKENSEQLMYEYTGREMITKILYVLRDFKGLKEGYVILGEKITNKLDSE